MKNTKTAAVPTVVIDATNIEAIAYNIDSTAQIQHSMSEPVDVSLPLPSSDPLLMKDTKTTSVPTVVIDDTNIEAIAYNIDSTAQIQPSMSEPVDVSLPMPRVRIDAKLIEAIVYNRAAKPPIQPSAHPSLMKSVADEGHQDAAVPTVVIDATNIEAIAYNIASTAQIQHSMSEPVDVSLPLPSSDPLLMKDTKTAAVPTVVIDDTNIEAIAYNIDSTAQIQPSMSEPVDVSLPVPRVRIDANKIEAIVYNRAAKPPIQPSAHPSLMKYTKTAAVPTVVIDATNIEAIAYNIASRRMAPPLAHRARPCSTPQIGINYDKFVFFNFKLG
ncbi:hypothetical protein QYE76_052004 [Lolium multiflorum]|uniref:Uncharacterized protein n=1 Tax=Lolium multiflorum TaxID=4521 RepID=A0AAD8STU9_LOLMU|nr:hypothetical protein QYE76_052004 [Lolium multiflorum]